LNKDAARKQIRQPFLLALMVVVGMIGGYRLNEMEDSDLIRFFPGDREISIGEVEEALRFLDNKYLYPTDQRALKDDALEQIFSRLDPYSVYIRPDELQQVNNNMNGNYRGIGIETIIFRDTLVVARVLDDSPADRAGIRKLDHILQLNGHSITGDSLDFQAFREHFQTTSDSTILTVYRPKGRDTLDFALVSEQVNTKSVNHHVMLNDSTLYIRIDQFVSRTYQEFMQVLEARQQDGRVPQLIIDLRDNPGGYLGEVTKILSQFFNDSDKTLVRTLIRNGRERTYETTGRTFYQVGEIVVLINRNSASGSEVMAGALQDWDRALVVGRPSYGKGLVQEQYPLNNGGAVRFTVANYFLPSGRSIQEAFELDSNYFHVDSVWKNGEREFRSLLKNRPLSGGQGIVPDIEVEDSLFERLFYPVFYAHTTYDEIALKLLEAQPGLLSMESDRYLEEFEPSTEDAGLRDFLNTHDYFDESTLLVLIKAKLAHYLYDEEVVLRLLLGMDPDVRRAMEEWPSDGRAGNLSS
jgi:carboxyl-terminal processing protease